MGSPFTSAGTTEVTDLTPTESRSIFRLLWRWWEARRISTPVEYVCIQDSLPRQTPLDGLQQTVRGWIPRQVYERITGTTFRRGEPQWIRNDHSARIARHPLYVPDERFDRSDARDPE